MIVYDETNQTMIGEVQFVLSWMSDAKRMCHKFKPRKSNKLYFKSVIQDRGRAIEGIRL